MIESGTLRKAGSETNNSGSTTLIEYLLVPVGSYRTFEIN
jgi:hypothetical protein